MKLEETIISEHKGKYEVISLLDNHIVRLNQQGLDSLLRMLNKNSPFELNDDEEKLMYNIFYNYVKLGSFNVKKHKTELKMVGVEILHNCNLNCVHCFLGKSKDEEKIDDSTFYDIVDDTIKLGAYQISITGGEPLLDIGLFNKLYYARKKGLRTTLNTNATLITNKKAKRLKEVGLAEAIVTLNGDKDSHEIIYGKNTYEPAVKGMIALRDANISMSANCIIHKGNNGIQEQFDDYMKKYFGITEIYYTPIIKIGQSNVPEEFLLSPEEAYAINKAHSCMNGKPENCSAGKKSLYVRNNGDVVPCLMKDKEIIGNIHNNKLFNIMNI